MYCICTAYIQPPTPDPVDTLPRRPPSHRGNLAHYLSSMCDCPLLKPALEPALHTFTLLYCLQAGSRWYCCDDAWIRCVEEEVVAACQAYMLFYLNRWGGLCPLAGSDRSSRSGACRVWICNISRIVSICARCSTSKGGTGSVSSNKLMTVTDGRGRGGDALLLLHTINPHSYAVPPIPLPPSVPSSTHWSAVWSMPLSQPRLRGVCTRQRRRRRC